MRRSFVSFLALLSLVSFATAAPVIDRSSDRGYILSLPVVTGSASQKIGLLVVLPGKGVKAKLERSNWAFAASRHGMALLALEVDYEQIRHERDVDTLHDRIQALIKEVQAEQPTIEDGPSFLGGTSRGGMAAIALALRHPNDYRAIGVACGAILAMGAEEDSANAKGQRFFFVHGSLDKVVPFKYFEKTLRRLSTDGALIETCVHEGAGHNLDTTDYQRIVRWMAALRAPAASPTP